MEDLGREIIVQGRSWAKSMRHYLKNNLKAKRAGGIAQVVEYLLSKHEATSLNTSTAKRNENE
jgi:hypothetical protein